MTPFKSFWMAGFECSDHVNAFGNRVNLLEATGHLRKTEEDYDLLQPLQIKTVREGICWSRVEQSPYRYDFSDVLTRLKCAEEKNIQIVWDLCHFGYPDDLTPLHPMFARRFTSMCCAFISFYRTHYPDGGIIVTPVNEVSFISWLGGEVRGTLPYCTNQGWEVKYGLMKAYIEAVAAMKEMDQQIMILSTEPLINIAPADESVEPELCRMKNEEQFQVLDMLTGRICPELGGNESFLDVIGINYYANNQWTYPQQEFICWKTKDCERGWKPLHELITYVHDRYNRPFIIAETSYPEDERPQWYEYMTVEMQDIVATGLPLLGVCIYPVIDRPDWDHTDRWHHSGIWDVYDLNTLKRRVHQPTFEAILKMQHTVMNDKQEKAHVTLHNSEQNKKQLV